MTDADVIEFPV